ncbi:MAG: DNA polymerase III psi subunit [Enterobacterales bacterium]|jgi:DNA polymerase III psi subunit
MLDENNRQSYLKAMGVTEWKLRSGEDESIINDDATLTAKTPAQSVADNQLKESLQQDSSHQSRQLEAEPTTSSPSSVPESVIAVEKKTIKGLKWLNQGSKNGLLVVLAQQRKDLSPESRVLMSKMLKGIQFLPSETGFAISGESISSEQELSLDGIKAILVLGNDAGRQLVRFSGAKIIAGTEYFSLDNRKIVITVHPDELLSNPEHKQQTWNDLKQLIHFFNNG